MPGGPTRCAWPKPTLAWTLGQFLNVDLNLGGAGATWQFFLNVKIFYSFADTD